MLEFSRDNVQVLSPGGDVFGTFCVDGAGGGIEDWGIAWLVQLPRAEMEFVAVTRSGPPQLASFKELLAALDVVGDPCEFPLADWPGVMASVIA